MSADEPITLSLLYDNDRLLVVYGAAEAAQLLRGDTTIPRDRLQHLAEAVLDAVDRSTRRGRLRADAAEGLRAAGAALADASLPPAIKQAIANAKEGSFMRLRLDGELVGIPWEAIPAGEHLLGMKLSLGRQLVSREDVPAPHATQDLGPLKILVVADPSGELPHARREGEALAGLLGAEGDRCRVTLRAGPLKKAELLSALRSHDALHFAGHCDPGSAESTEGWRLHGETLSATDIAAMAGGQAGPALVFAHACRSAGGPSHSVLAAFVQAGSRHVIGSLWDVPDDDAPEAAGRFWQQLLAGQAVGEALRSTRLAAGLLSGAAYVLFGDPCSTPFLALRRCTGCNQPALATSQRFCHECGQPRSLGAAAKEERRHVTVVSVGVDPGESEDAEDVFEHLNAHYATIAEVVRRYGGSVDRFAGDAVVAVFGAPVAHENDPERALLAALEASASIGAAAGLRAGVDTGTAILGGLGDDQRRDHALAGAVLLNAAKLMRMASPGQVLCSRATRAQAGAAVRTVDMKKGLGHEAWRALGPRSPTERRRGRRVRRRPLIGRQEELDRLRSIFADVRRERKPATVSIGGQSGIGKSRLLDEFLTEAKRAPAPPRVAVGWARPYAGGDPYGPLVGLLLDLLNLPPASTADQVGEALLQALQQEETSPPQELPEWIPALATEAAPAHTEDLAVLSSLLGLSPPSPREDATTRRHRIQLAVQHLIERLASRSPLILAVVDLHWAPDATLDVLDGLARFLGRVPVLLVTLARPALYERRPHFGEGRPDHLRLDLAPLGEAEARSLAELATEGHAELPRAALEAAIHRSDGNPLFLEELVKALQERGGSETEEENVPITLEGVLAARLDLCSEAEQAVLSRAAVVGRTFWEGALTAMGASDDTPSALQSLRERGILLRREASQIPGDQEYLFKHALLRDAAYARIGRDKRAALHRAAAAWFDGLPESTEGHLDARAEHYERAGAPATAASLHAEAGDRAVDARSDEEAQGHYRAALALLEELGSELPPDCVSVTELSQRLGDSLARTGEFQPALEAYTSALASPDLDPARRADVLRRQARIHDSRGMFDAAMATLDEATACRPEDADDTLHARILSDRGWVLCRLGSFEEADESYRRSLEILGPGGAAADRAQVHNLLGSLHYSRGELDSAETHHQAALSLRESLGDTAGLGRCYNNLGIVAERRGDYEGAAGWHARSVRLKAAAGDRPGLALSYNNLGALYWREGELERAAAALGASLDLKRRLGNRWGEAITLANLAEVLLDSGNLDASALRLAEAELRAAEAGNHSLVPEIKRLRAQVAQGRGRKDEARRFAQSAVEAAQALGDTGREAVALRVLGEITGRRELIEQALEMLQAAEDQAETRRAQRALDDLDAHEDA